MMRNRSIPEAAVIPELGYRDVGEAAAWLCRVFGFRERLRIGNHRCQLVYGSGAVVVNEDPDAGAPQRSHGLLVRVEDAAAHHAWAVEQGAKILRPPADHPYGERQYTALDPGGHTWTFSQSLADVDPASWGGVLVDNGL